MLALIARGLSTREIATQLVVEESTVRTHVKRIQMKLAAPERGSTASTPTSRTPDLVTSSV